MGPASRDQNQNPNNDLKVTGAGLILPTARGCVATNETGPPVRQ